MENRSLLTLFWIVLAINFTIAMTGVCLAMPPLDLTTLPAAPDYKTAQGWIAKPASPTAPVDVFYVYPTVLFNDTDWIMDTTNTDMRSAARGQVITQASVFAGQANIYAPMYRQMNLAGLGLNETDGAPLQQIVHDDIWRAFTHYLKYENNGRPFFLAGHSQGSMIITDLMLEHWGTTGAEKQLVAALLLGWSLTAEDLDAHQSIQLCKSSDQTGCIISYNTMAAGRQLVAPTLKSGALAVNPLSWTTDGTFVSAEQNLGSVFFDNSLTPTTYPNFTSAQIVDGGLIVQPKNVDLVTVEGGHFPQGIYHAFDYSLFFDNLKVNIAERIEAFSR